MPLVPPVAVDPVPVVGLAHRLHDGGTPHGESDIWAGSPEGVAFFTGAET